MNKLKVYKINLIIQINNQNSKNKKMRQKNKNKVKLFKICKIWLIRIVF